LVRQQISIGMQVMIRPRGGDFCYTADEFETMRRDILVAKKLGADGIVMGVLDTKGNVDIERTRQLVDLARPLNVTFHRSVDMSVDLLRAAEDVCQTGANRILTSGGEPTAWQGVETISRVVKAVRGRISVIACGGIDRDNAATIVERTCVREIHVGLGRSVASPMLYCNPRIAMGSVPGREYQRRQVLEEDVMNLRSALAQS
jgi:copper homeostasis protein